MKNAMPTRKSLGKISTYLRMFGLNHGGQSNARAKDRNPNKLPSSTKVGARSDNYYTVPVRHIRQLQRRCG